MGLAFAKGDKVAIKHTLLKGEVVNAKLRQEDEAPEVVFGVNYKDNQGQDQHRYFEEGELEKLEAPAEGGGA